jgi:hypothetical protein
MADKKEVKPNTFTLPEQVIKGHLDPKKKGVAAEVSKMGVLGTPSQMDMDAVMRMMKTLEEKGM